MIVRNVENAPNCGGNLAKIESRDILLSDFQLVLEVGFGCSPAVPKPWAFGRRISNGRVKHG
jgi:hypothetical protein